MKASVILLFSHYFRVFSYYTGRKLYILMALAFLGGISECFGISMLLPLFDYNNKDSRNQYSQVIYNFLTYLHIESSLSSFLIILFLAFLLKGAFEFFRLTVTASITTGLRKQIRFDFFNHYASMNYEFFTNSNVGYLNNLATVEIPQLVASTSIYIELILNNIFILIYFIAASIINWVMTFVVLLFGLLLFYIMRRLSTINRKLSTYFSNTNAQIQSYFIQSLTNFKYLKATESFGQISEKLYKSLNDNRIYNLKIQLNNAIPRAIIEPASVLLLGGLFLYHASYLNKPATEIMVTLFFVYKAFTRLFTFQTQLQQFAGNAGSIDVIEKARKDLSKHKEISGEKLPDKITRCIELKNVNFSYGPKQVIFDVSMSIPRNNCIGIVGSSGAGKTTLFDILTGLISPQSGEILLNGIKYKNIALRELRRKIGYVTQDPVVFNDTIEANITLWKSGKNNPDEFRPQIDRAVKLSHSTEFIAGSENGLQTVLGDDGIKLSGGQRQRIAIAREIFKEPEIMIFDEATSSLDSDTERIIQKSIESLIGTLTIVIIAHRLSTIKNCDYIYVIDNGRIIEEGSFDILYSDKNSTFLHMCQMQNV